MDTHSYSKPKKNGGRSALYFLLLRGRFSRQSTSLIELVIPGSYLSLANADRREEVLLELVWEIAKLVLLIAVDGTI